jgi:hypothetical protein
MTAGASLQQSKASQPARDSAARIGSQAFGRIPSVVAQVFASPGRELEPATRGSFESKFGHEFSDIRIHADELAGQAADAIGAKAFTMGNHVGFARGRYAPDTRRGRWLLAHELAHSLTQRGVVFEPRSAAIVDDHAAEQDADRVADAIFEGRSLPSLTKSTPGIQLQRVTSVERISDDEKIAHLDNGTRLHVHRVRWLTDRHERVGYGRVTSGINRQNVWLDVEWCRGRNQGTVQVGANIPDAVLRAVVGAVTSGRDIDATLRGIDVTPYVEANVLQSGSFRIGLHGELTFNVQGQVTGGQGRVSASTGPLDVGVIVGTREVGGRQAIEAQATIEITPGRGSETAECQRTRTKVYENVRFECRSERDIPARTIPEMVQVQDHQSQYIYFNHATAVLAPGQPNLRALTEALQHGFRVAGVRGFTSPEGPMAPGPRFMGNERLARERAVAGAELVADVARRTRGSTGVDDSFVGGRAAVTPTGEGELYSIVPLDVGSGAREVEGAPLAEHAATEFETQPAEERHRTPERQARLEAPATTSAQKADIVYPLLRRAEITLVRSRTETVLREEPARVETSDTTCPTDVIDQLFPRSAGTRVTP